MPIALIAAAIALSQPHLPPRTLRSYAAAVQREARFAKVDPLLIVAIVANESHWMASVQGGTGGNCIGLGQICLTNYPACQKSMTDDVCVATRALLLDPFYNLHVIAVTLRANRNWCRSHVNGGAERHYLAGYQGYANCGRRRVRGRWVDKKLSEVPLTQRVLAARHGKRCNLQGSCDGS